MASTIQKITDKLTGKDKHTDNPNSSNHGPHSSSATNKLDPTVDSNLDGRHNATSHVGGYGNTNTVGGQPTTGYAGTTTTNTHAGTGQTGITGGTHQTATAGPHSSNLANKLDPRVDSDRDGSHNVGGGYGAAHTQHQPHSTTTGYTGANTGANTGYTGTTTGSNTGYGSNQSTNAGPHSSNLLNKLDPRVDSDRDGRSNPTSHTGGYGQTHTGTSHTTGTTGGLTGAQTTHDYTTHPNSNAGPHSSNVLNKLDPRVDSDRDGRADPTSRVGGYGQTQTGVGHTTGHTTDHTTGHNTIHNTSHGTSGIGGTHGHSTTGAQGYTGTNTTHDNPKSTNTGPHSSNLLNKLDPRVDSDRDGRDDPTSKTGGYGQTQTGGSVGRY